MAVAVSQRSAHYLGYTNARATSYGNQPIANLNAPATSIANVNSTGRNSYISQHRNPNSHTNQRAYLNPYTDSHISHTIPNFAHNGSNSHTDTISNYNSYSGANTDSYSYRDSYPNTNFYPNT